MKKFLLFAFAGFAMTAMANELTLSNEFTATNAVVDVPAATSLNAVDDLSGEYRFMSVTNRNCNASSLVTIVKTDEGYDITGLTRSHTLPIKATVTDGILTIAAGQVIVNHATYGEVCLYTMVNAKQYNRTINPQFQINEDGSLTLVNGLGFISRINGGEYDGASLGDTYNGGYALMAVNGTMVTNYVKSDWTPDDTPQKTVKSVVQAADGEGILMGIEDVGWVNFTYDADNNVQFDNDSILYYNTTYCNSQFTKCGTTSSGGFGSLYGNGPQGTIDFEKGELTIGPWALLMANISTGSKSILNGRKSGSVITFPVNPTSAITDVNVEKTNKARKYIVDGQLIIERDGKKYNVAGQVVK